MMRKSRVGVYAVANWNEAGTKHGAFYTYRNLRNQARLLVGPAAHCGWSQVKAETGFDIVDEFRASHRAVAEAPYGTMGLPWHSFTRDAARPLSDTPSEVVVEMLPLSYIFKAGHRIRLTLFFTDSSSPAAPATRIEHSAKLRYSSNGARGATEGPHANRRRSCTPRGRARHRLQPERTSPGAL